MSKIIKRVIMLLVAVFVIWIGIQWWYGLFSGYIPWKKSFYINYEDYRNTLENYNFFSQVYFAEDLPDGNSSLKAYSQQDSSYDRYTGYSIVLEKDVYNTAIKERMACYLEVSDELKIEPLLCGKQCDVSYSVQNLNFPDLNISYLDNLIRHSDQKQDYYFLVLMKHGISRGTCYTGVIANDTTHEIIEFSVETWEDA